MIRLAIPLLAAGPLAAQDLELDWPLDCQLGESCFVQQYVDRDPGPEAADFTCGPLSYDGHEGTDIALTDLAAQAAGVEVRAAAAGEVTGLRNDMPDALQTGPDAPDVVGRECGNGVVLRHPGGWETQYCHMERGSIAVAVGDPVAAGAPLGRVGLSGQTQFPHLHITVRRDGETIDPFEPAGDPACGATGAGLWDEPVVYRAGGIIGAGFANAVPDYEAVKAGTAERAVGVDDPMVLWGYLFGGRSGDVVRIEIRRDGTERADP